MASQNIARLGIVLGLDSGELVAKITEAQQKFGQFKAQIKRDSEDAAKEIVRLEMATRNYGKTLTEVEKIEEQIRLGKYKNQPDVIIGNLLKQAAAYDKVAASAKSAQMAQMGAKGGLTAQQSAALGYQTTDIVTSLAGGQNPFMVLLQQGGQLKDQFGGFKPMFAGIAEALTPVKLAVLGIGGAITTLGLAFYQGSEESRKFNNALILTGGYAGISEERFNALSKSIGSNYSTAIGSVKDAMQQLVASGQFTNVSLQSVASTIIRIASLSGQSAAEVASSLIPALDGSASSAKKLNETYHFLTLEQYKHIELLNQEGKAQEAIKYTSEALNKQLDAQGKNLGYIEKMWKNVKNSASDFWDWAKSIGKEEDPTVTALKRQVGLLEKLLPNEKAIGQKRINEALDEYKRLAAIVQAEEDKRISEAEKKAKEGQKIKDRADSGGFDTEKRLAQERAKIIADINYQESAEGLDKVAQLKLKRDRDIENVQSKLKNESPSTLRAFGWTMEKNAILETWRIQSQYEKDVQSISDEQKKKWAERAANEQDAINQEKERLEYLRENLFATKEQIDLDNSRLKTQQELAALARERNMLPADREAAAQRIKFLGEEREALIHQREELMTLQNINHAVFSNMSNALDNFARTGKLSFSNLTRSIIQDLLSIQLRSQMTQLFGGVNLLSNLSTAFTYGTNIGSEQTAMLAKQDVGMRASGGPVSGNSPYIVGEQGPELFVPQGSGTIIPNGKLADMGNGSPTVVNNYNIHAIDTQSFEQRLYQSSGAIWAANQYATKNTATNRSRT